MIITNTITMRYIGLYACSLNLGEWHSCFCLYHDECTLKPVSYSTFVWPQIMLSGWPFDLWLFSGSDKTHTQ